MCALILGSKLIKAISVASKTANSRGQGRKQRSTLSRQIWTQLPGGSKMIEVSWHLPIWP